MFTRIKKDEERLKHIKHWTIQEHRNADSVDCEVMPIPHLNPFQTNEYFFQV